MWTSLFHSLDGPATPSEDDENDAIANVVDDNDDESEGELEGAVGGETLPSVQTDSTGNTDERSLLDELQQEIDRIQLLSPTGQSKRINFIFI